MYPYKYKVYKFERKHEVEDEFCALDEENKHRNDNDGVHEPDECQRPAKNSVCPDFSVA